MNLIELICLIFILACGLLLGRFFWQHFGFLYGVLGFAIGISAGFGVFDILRLLFDFWYQLFPLRPICSAVKCKSEDYSWQYDDERGSVFKCQCDDLYLKAKRRFMKITSNNSTLPFMK